LGSELKGLWSFSVEYDCRVIFQFLERNTKVLLIDIGSHDEVY
jgi:mRNA-degrading endonuclease YafQ of YafQ-DinJ toxin-antitoxin module